VRTPSWVGAGRVVKAIPESPQGSQTTSEKKARQFLQEREGKVALNIPVVPKADKLRRRPARLLFR